MVWSGIYLIFLIIYVIIIIIYFVTLIVFWVSMGIALPKYPEDKVMKDYYIAFTVLASLGIILSFIPTLTSLILNLIIVIVLTVLSYIMYFKIVPEGNK